MAVPEIPNIRKKGLKSAYAPNGEHKDVIYFATDTGEVLLNGSPYANDIPEGGSEGQVLMYAGPRQVKWATIEGSDVVTENTYAYGVEWEKDQSSPALTRIGNLSLHKTLPIQSKLKGCVATIDGQIKYWLKSNNWYLKEDNSANIIVENPEFDSSSDLTKINIPEFTTGYFIGTCVVLIDSNSRYQAAGFIKSISEKQIVGARKQLTIEWHKNSATSEFFTNGGIMVLGSNLSGKDGVVKVYVPEFYIKSRNIGNKRQVLISEKKIDNSWEKQPACLVDAYHCTLWKGTPNSESGIYTDKLESNTLVSIAYNFGEDYKGGVYNSNSQPGDTDPITDSWLAKPITGITRETARTYAQNQRSEGGNGHLLTYKEWKNIFYWLYVIEFANFNVKLSYSADINGYKTGGLFKNYTVDTLTTLMNTITGDGNTIFAQCGLTNAYGNNSCSTKINISAGTLPLNRYRGFEDICLEFGTMLDGIVINGLNTDNTFNIYINNSSDQSTNSDDVSTLSLLGTQEAGESYIKEFTLGDTAELLPLTHDSVTTTSTHKCSMFTADDMNKPDKNKYGVYVNDGCKNIGNDTGLAAIDTTVNITDPNVWTYGFRTVVNIDPIENV